MLRKEEAPKKGREWFGGKGVLRWGCKERGEKKKMQGPKTKKGESAVQNGLGSAGQKWVPGGGIVPDVKETSGKRGVCNR